MDRTIDADAKTMRDVSRGLDEEQSSADDIIAELISIEEEVRAAWASPNAEMYLEGLREVRQELESIKFSASDISRALSETAERMEQAEASGTGQGLGTA